MPRWLNRRRVLGCLVVGLAIVMPAGADPSTGRDIKVTARLVDTETGTVLGVSSVRIFKDDRVQHLLRTR